MQTVVAASHHRKVVILQESLGHRERGLHRGLGEGVRGGFVMCYTSAIASIGHKRMDRWLDRNGGRSIPAGRQVGGGLGLWERFAQEGVGPRRVV